MLPDIPVPPPGQRPGCLIPNITPRVVVLDPEVTLWTPAALWLASGIRSLDHAIETMYSPGCHPVNDVLAMEAVSRLFKFLPLSKIGSGKC